jgi:hypothetical protein
MLTHSFVQLTGMVCYATGSLFWPAGFRDNARVLILAEQIESWEYA